MSREKKKPKKVIPEDEVWCPELWLVPNPGAGSGPSYERCPKCNKRLKVLFYNCHGYVPDAACYHPYIPKHKNKKAQ